MPPRAIEIRQRNPMTIIVRLNDGRTRLNGCIDAATALAAFRSTLDRIGR
jgi:hypothetical protein